MTATVGRAIPALRKSAEKQVLVRARHPGFDVPLIPAQTAHTTSRLFRLLRAVRFIRILFSGAAADDRTI